jgi:paraquat-inducible protein A
MGMRSFHCCKAILPTDQNHCLRYYSTCHVRRRHSLQWTLALLLTSFIFYIQINMLPIIVTKALGSKINSAIMAGVILLYGECY